MTLGQALAFFNIDPLGSSRSRNTREWGVETSLSQHLGRVSAGWHARMSSRLAGKGACALCCASVSNIRLWPLPLMDKGGNE